MTILNEIIEYKKTLLERKYYDKKLEILQDNGNVKRRKLIDSLNYDRTLSVIAEIKSKSPSVPQLPQRDLVQQVKAYQKYGANAISILTDEKYFGGSFERLNQLSKITSLPVLCKDFIIDKIPSTIDFEFFAAIFTNSSKVIPASSSALSEIDLKTINGTFKTSQT